MGNFYSPLGAGSPRSPLTPRTKKAKLAFILGLISLAFSLFAFINSTIRLSGQLIDFNTNGDHRMRRVVMKSFLLAPGKSQLLYQSKPLLIAEEELTQDEVDMISKEQNAKLRSVLKGVETDAEKRKAIVRQLITQFAAVSPENTPLTEEVLEELRKSSKFSLSEESEPQLIQEGEFVVPAVEELVASLSLEDLTDGTETVDTDDDYEEVSAEEEAELKEYIAKISADASDHGYDYIDLVLPEEDSLSSSSAWDTGRGNADDNVESVPQDEQVQEAPRPGPEASFIQVLETCKTLECLRDAHERKKEKRQFNFPHAIVIGWQKSATTSIYAHLGRHPRVLSSEEKEPEFFTAKCHDDPLNGCSLGQQAYYIENTLQRDEFVAQEGRVMAFEASTHYAMNGNILAGPILQALPWVKIIASLREPISRAASMLVHLSDRDKRGCLSRPGATLFNCLMTESQLVGHPGPWNEMDSPYGNYSYALGHWIENVPRNQLHIVQYETIVADTEESISALKSMKQFLGLDSGLVKGDKGYLDTHNVRKDRISPEGWAMTKSEYQTLVDKVKPDAEKVAELVEKGGWATSK